MTYLQLVNRVLLRLREDEVESFEDADPYVRLIGNFVNEAKREVEDAWNWTVLRESAVITTHYGESAYAVNGFNNRSRLLFDSNGQVSAWNMTTKEKLRGPMPGRWMTQKLTTNNTPQRPLYFDFNGESEGHPVINVFPIPDDIYELQVDGVVPQDDLVNEGDRLKIPSGPVVLLAWAYAIGERGEDGGLSYNEIHERYERALSDAVAYDMLNHQDELTARVV